MVTEGKRRSLIDVVQDSIIDMVVERTNNGAKETDGCIFSEGELAEQFQVSRSTIREAIRSLEVRGFVERVHGVGIRLHDRSLEVVSQSLLDMITRSGADYPELLQVRRIIEVEAAGLAARYATVEIAWMQEAIAIMEDKTASFERYTQADFSFHTNVVKATKNKTLEALAMAFKRITQKLINASIPKNDRPEINVLYHKRILNCIVSHDVEGARKAMSDHLDATEKNIAMLNP